MLVVLLIHLAVGVALIALGDRLGKWSFVVAATPMAASLVVALGNARDILDGRPLVEEAGWVSGLGLRFDLRIDALSLLMVLLVAGIGVLVCAYSIGYFSHPKPGTGRLAGLLTLFAGAMTGLVAADHVAMLFLCWEATSITSYLLIGNNDRDPRARAAALQALLITGAGGLVLLAGLLIVGQEAGSWNLHVIVADAPTGGLVAGGLVCVLIGAFTKSAQQPFGSWLPGAMVAPTPVSAYLHSATMVKAGVYLVARMAPAFAGEGSWRVLTVTVGLVTMIVGGYRALRQTDLKLLLAMGTTSQLGLLIALFGLGLPEVTQAAIALLVAHAVFKSALFMVVGIIDHELGTRDVRQVAIGGPGWRTVQVVAVVGAISMAGAPPVLGFVAKELVVDSLLHERHAVAGGVVILAVVLLGSVLTFAYSGRFVLGVLGRLREPVAANEHDHQQQHAHDHGHTPRWYFVGPAAVLTVFTVVLGLHADLLTRLHTAASKTLHPLADVPYLALWHGVNAALLWSLAVMAAGTVLVVFRRQVAALQPPPLHRLSTERGYLAFLRGLNRLAHRVAAVVQSGSLPLYVAIILAVATGVPLIGLLAGDGWVELPQWIDLPVHIAIALVLVVGAVATAVLRRRFAAVLLLGSVGYGMAAFFVAQGAPDLALTQFAIETLGIVLFVLVLRALPEDGVAHQPRLIRLARGLVSALVGVFVFVFALAMSQARVEEPISSEFVERSVPEGKGGNVVNVILVDFRGLDTLGEITVLAVAAIGALGLVRAGARRPVPQRTGEDG